MGPGNATMGTTGEVGEVARDYEAYLHSGEATAASALATSMAALMASGSGDSS